jgi:hypothetical protein
MGQQAFEGWTDWAQGAAVDSSYEAILASGKAAMADMIRALSARGLPPGAVIEIEFAVRRRETALA